VCIVIVSLTLCSTNAAGVSIIQPVLQWGSSAAGGGQYWAIASWFVGGAHTVYSDLKQVSSGDTIYGNMTLDATSQKVGRYVPPLLLARSPVSST